MAWQPTGKKLPSAVIPLGCQTCVRRDALTWLSGVITRREAFMTACQ